MSAVEINGMKRRIKALEEKVARLEQAHPMPRLIPLQPEPPAVTYTPLPVVEYNPKPREMKSFDIGRFTFFFEDNHLAFSKLFDTISTRIVTQAPLRNFHVNVLLVFSGQLRLQKDPRVESLEYYDKRQNVLLIFGLFEDILLPSSWNGLKFYFQLSDRADDDVRDTEANNRTWEYLMNALQ